MFGHQNYLEKVDFKYVIAIAAIDHWGMSIRGHGIKPEILLVSVPNHKATMLLLNAKCCNLWNSKVGHTDNSAIHPTTRVSLPPGK